MARFRSGNATAQALPPLGRGRHSLRERRARERTFERQKDRRRSLRAQGRDRTHRPLGAPARLPVLPAAGRQVHRPRLGAPWPGNAARARPWTGRRLFVRDRRLPRAAGRRLPDRLRLTPALHPPGGHVRQTVSVGALVRGRPRAGSVPRASGRDGTRTRTGRSPAATRGPVLRRATGAPMRFAGWHARGRGRRARPVERTC